jgi:hypothetical protein
MTTEMTGQTPPTTLLTENSAASAAAPTEGAPATSGTPPVDKPAEEPKSDPKASEAAPEPFKLEDIKFSSTDVTVDPEIGGEFVELVNKFSLPRDAVAGLVALQEKAMKANSEAGSRDWNDMQTKWVNEIKNDAEIGGNKWPEVQTKIGQLLDTYGSPELREALDLTGAGNNPAVARFMSKVASVLSESGHILASMPAKGEKSAAELLYPNQGKT